MNQPHLSATPAFVPETIPYKDRVAGNDSGKQPLEKATEQGRRIQELVEKIETVADPNARMLAQECIQSILEFYGAGLQRILYTVRNCDTKEAGTMEALTGDSLVSGLLLIHGLHPISLETRFLKALEKVRPYLQSHGGNVELVSLEQGRAKLRMLGACDTCASSAVTLELALRQAIQEACPDLSEFEVEGGAAPLPEDSDQDGQVLAPEWVLLPDANGLQEGNFMTLKALKIPLLICRLDSQLYAYRDHCPICNMPLHLGTLVQGTFACDCGHAFDIRSAGRSVQNAKSHLDPFPLIEENGVFRVAVR
jgi:Fe-S cluster biogenesis protein NfuA/nitrite reductase/ring-hydroxylating ferredoxin subunit